MYYRACVKKRAEKNDRINKRVVYGSYFINVATVHINVEEKTR